MKHIILFASLVILTSRGALAGPVTIETSSLAELRGTYRGYTPTDESALRLGEIEITITDRVVSFRAATGLRIDEGEIPVADFRPMSPGELATVYVPGSSLPRRSFGFQTEDEYPRLIFLKNPRTKRLFPALSEFGLIVKVGELNDILGPTALLTPAQLEKISCERFLRSTEFFFGRSWRGGLIPRLAHEGRAPRTAAVDQAPSRAGQ